MGLIYVQSRAEFLNYKNFTVTVMYSGSQCPACVTSKPYFEQMAQKSQGHFLVVDRTQLQLTDKDIGFTMTAIPTFVKYKKGSPVCPPIVGFDMNRVQQLANM